jgi:hypothetical protein
MTDKTPYPIASEEIEPTFAMITGRLFARCEAVKDDRSQLETACMNLWWALDGMNKITIGVGTATHASLAVMNHMRDVGRYIRERLGVDPWEHPMWSRK